MVQSIGIIARTVAALRYAANGTTPAEWFGPGKPLTPQAPETVKGRAFDFPVSVNLNYMPRAREAAGFAKLRALADASAIIRMVLERQKSLIIAQEWKIKARIKATSTAATDRAIAEITEFLECPDGLHDWSQWLNAVLEDLLVIDAVSIYARPTRSGGLYALEIIDGATITPLLAADGRQPRAPDASYEQVLKGLPAVQYTTDELIYYPQNFRSNRIYGYSAVEQIISVGEQSIERMKSQLAVFKYGNVGDGYFTAPDGFNPDQVHALETHWNSLMSSVDGKRMLPFLPSGASWHPTKTDVLADAFDEWLIRLICFVFGITPTPFLKQQGLGQGSAQSDKESAEEGGIFPTMQYIRRLMNRIIARHFGRTDLEFSWVNDTQLDPKTQAEIDDKNFRNGKKTINQLRDAAGDEAIEGGDVPVILVGNTLIPVASLTNLPLEPAAPVAPAVPVVDAQTEVEAPGADAIDAQKKSPDDELSKAAKASAVSALERNVANYLAKRGEVIGNQIAAELGLSKAAMDDYSGQIEEALDGVDWNWTDFSQVVEPSIAGIGVAAGMNAVSALGVFDEVILKAMTRLTVEYAAARSAEMVGMLRVGDQLIPNPNAKWTISGATRDMLRQTVTTAMEIGASNQELAKAIKESAAFGRERAINIARTESAKADVQGNIAGWKETGLVAGRKWLTAPGCCDLCHTYDGMIVGIHEPFPQGDAPAHPSCRCDEVAVLPEDMPDAQAITPPATGS